MNQSKNLKQQLLGIFYESFVNLLHKQFGNKMGREDCFAIALAVAYFREKFKQQFLGNRESLDQFGTVQNVDLLAQVKKAMEINFDAPALARSGNSLFQNKPVPDDESHCLESPKIASKDVQESIRLLAKLLLSNLEFDEIFFESIIFRIIQKVSNLELHFETEHEIKREFDDIMDSKPENSKILEDSPQKRNRHSLKKSEKKDKKYTKVGDESLLFGQNSPNQKHDSFKSSPNPKKSKRNGIFWYVDFVSLCNRIFANIFQKIIQQQNSEKFVSKHIRNGEKIFSRLQKKYHLNLNSSKRNKNILIFIGILQSKISTVFKSKNQFKAGNAIEEVLSEKDIVYLYEDNLLFDIDFTPKCDNLPDCMTNLIGIEIKKKEIPTFCNVANISQITTEEAEYVSSRLKDYLSNDQSNLYIEPLDNYKKTLDSIKENMGEDKSKQNIVKRKSSEKVVEIEQLKKSFISIEFHQTGNLIDQESESENLKIMKNFERGFKDLNNSENFKFNQILDKKNNERDSKRDSELHTHYRKMSIGSLKKFK